MTTNKRICVMITPDMEKEIIEMRKTDEFCRKSISEIVRILIQRGMDSQKETA